MLDTKDSPTEEDPSGFEFQQAFVKLSVDSIGISRLAFDSEREVSGQGRLTKMSDNVQGIAIR